MDKVAEAADYYDLLEADGLGAFTSDTLSTSYLQMIQPGSAIAAANPTGTWRNSTTGENYGNKVEVVVLAFTTIWSERSSEHPFNTVGRYAPNSIDVEIEKPKAGSNGFSKMINPLTGNKIEHLYMYALTLPEYPDAGILYFSPTVSNMSACKAWNSQIRNQRLPSGKSAAIHAYSWILTQDLVSNPKKPTEQMAKFMYAVKGRLLDPDWHKGNIMPLVASANTQNLTLLASSEDVHDADVNED